MVRATLLIAIMLIESSYMISLKTDVVHRDNLEWAIRAKDSYEELFGLTCIVESANMHPSENLKILASNDARMRGWKRVQTIRKDMTYLLVYEKE